VYAFAEALKNATLTQAYVYINK